MKENTSGPYKSAWHEMYPEKLADKLCEYTDKCLEDGTPEEKILEGIDKIEAEYHGKV